MRRASALACAIAAIATACAGEATESPPQETKPQSYANVLGVTWTEAGGGTFAELDPLTLRRASERAIAIGDPPISSAARSPDGSVLALGSGVDARVRLLDVDAMRALGRPIRLGTSGYVSDLAWAGPRTLVVHVGERAVVVLDATTRGIVRSSPLRGAVVARDRTPSGFAVALAPRGRIGPVTLAVVGRAGIPRTRLLREIQAGHDSGRQRGAGLAVAPNGGRALVVAADGRVADVDLASLTVRYRALSRPVSLLGRLREWLEPAAQAKVVEGPLRHAVWLGDHMVAVSGVDEHAAGAQLETTPAGLHLIDTRDWTVKTVDAAVSDLSPAGEVLLAYGGGNAQSGGERPAGLSGYGPDGRRRFHLFEDELVSYVQVAGELAYVGDANSTRFRIVDIAAGRVVGEATTDEPTIVLEKR